MDRFTVGDPGGCGEIIFRSDGKTPLASDDCGGKISYLGGHQYQTTVPITSGSQSQGTRLFLNALSKPSA